MRASSFLVVLAITACDHDAPAPATPPRQEPQFYKFDIGALHATALKDGDLHEDNDGKSFGLGHTPAEVDTLLGRPTKTIDLSLQTLLVVDADKTFLFDTGEGNALVASMKASGTDPVAVTDIFISHYHGDHIGGLLAFPNAAIHMSAPEWDAFQKEPKKAALAKSIGTKVVTFAPNASLFPNVKAVAVEGHTPGHSAYEIGNGNDRLLYIGDSMHHHIISVRRPDWPNDYDTDKDVARASRRALLEKVSTEHTRLFAPHFPFPGIGHIAKTADSFTWDPEVRSARDL